MLYNSDIKTVSVNIEKRFPRSGCLEAWNRIKKFIEEEQNKSTNSKSMPLCDGCEKPFQELNCYCDDCLDHVVRMGA